MNQPNILTYFLALFIAVLIVTPTCFYLFKCTSYIKIALIVVVVYLIILGVIYLIEWKMPNLAGNKSVVLTTQPANSVPTANIPDLGDELPFDGLPPSELIKNMQYLYRATSNPLNIPSQQGTLTDADNTLNKDRAISEGLNGTLTDGNNSAVMPNYMSYASMYYPNLTADQVDTRDCLNSMGADSCFQSAKMFEKNNSVLDKGINSQNAGQIVREDFVNFQEQNAAKRIVPEDFVNFQEQNRVVSEDFVNFQEPASVNLYSPTPFFDGNRNGLSSGSEPIFMNAPGNIGGNISGNGCRGCKVDICTGDYCATTNKLFN